MSSAGEPTLEMMQEQLTQAQQMVAQLMQAQKTQPQQMQLRHRDGPSQHDGHADCEHCAPEPGVPGMGRQK